MCQQIILFTPKKSVQHSIISLTLTLTVPFLDQKVEIHRCSPTTHRTTKEVQQPTTTTTHFVKFHKYLMGASSSMQSESLHGRNYNNDNNNYRHCRDCSTLVIHTEVGDFCSECVRLVCHQCARWVTLRWSAKVCSVCLPRVIPKRCSITRSAVQSQSM